MDLQQSILETASLHQISSVGPDLAAYGVDPVFKSGTDLYNADLDDETDTVSFYNCSTLGYNATYNIPNTDTTVTVTAPLVLLPQHCTRHMHCTLFDHNRDATLVQTDFGSTPISCMSVTYHCLYLLPF